MAVEAVAAIWAILNGDDCEGRRDEGEGICGSMKLSETVLLKLDPSGSRALSQTRASPLPAPLLRVLALQFKTYVSKRARGL